MKDILKGHKTKITGWVMALGPALAMAGYAYDPEQVTAWIDEFSGLIAGVYIALGAAVQWFRNLAGK